MRLRETLLQTMAMLSLQDKVSLMRRPRYLNDRTCSIVKPLMLKSRLVSTFLWEEWRSMLLVLEVFSLRPLFDIHKLANFDRIGGKNSGRKDFCWYVNCCVICEENSGVRRQNIRKFFDKSWEEGMTKNRTLRNTGGRESKRRKNQPCTSRSRGADRNKVVVKSVGDGGWGHVPRRPVDWRFGWNFSMFQCVP